MKEKKTIYDVARDAGVSIATVSRVINGKGYVSEDTRRRVEEACEDYHPLASAREIQSRKSNTIGIITNHQTDYFFMNETFLNALRAIAEVTKNRGYRLMFEITNEKEEVCNLYHEQKVDGMIILGGNRGGELIATLEEKEIPFVLVGDCKESATVSQVEINDRQAVYEAVRYLIGLGHRKIGIITGSLQYASGINRLEGYREALAEAGIPIREEYIECCDGMTDVKVENLTKKLLYLPDRITALVAFNDMVAVSAYKAAKEIGIEVGKDLSVIGFDDDRIASYITPPLTTIWQPSYEKGERAARILLDALEEKRLPREREELKCIMIYRDSCVDIRQENQEKR